MNTHGNAPPRLVELNGTAAENELGKALNALKMHQAVIPLQDAEEFRTRVLRKARRQKGWYIGMASTALLLLLFSALLFRGKPAPWAAPAPAVTSTAEASLTLQPNRSRHMALPPVATKKQTAKAFSRPSMTLPVDLSADELLEESQLLLIVSRRMEDGQVEDAMHLLDDYDVRFPKGKLKAEALTSRLKGYVFQRQFENAAAVDKQLAGLLGNGPRYQELQLFQAEALAEGRQFEAAFARIEALEGQTLSGPLQERLLWLKVICLQGMGREAKYLEVLRTYVSTFPNGKHAEEAHRHLADEK